MAKLISKNIKAIIFDHDDTLVGTIEAKWAQHKHIALKYYNKQLLDKELIEHWGKPLRELLGIWYNTDDLDLAYERVLKHHADFPKRLFDETLGVVENLRQQGKFVGIVTGTARLSLEFDIKTLGIPPGLFDYIQTEDDSDFHKPDPRVFDPAKAWLASHGIKPNQVIYIGDSLHDMNAANGAGFGFIGVTTGLITKEKFTRADAKSIDSLTQLLG
jgi:phosphoglycolate phosphatase